MAGMILAMDPALPPDPQLVRQLAAASRELDGSGADSTPCRSEPAPGSVMAMAEMAAPDTIFGSQACFSASLA